MLLSYYWRVSPVASWFDLGRLWWIVEARPTWLDAMRDRLSLVEVEAEAGDAHLRHGRMGAGLHGCLPHCAGEHHFGRGGRVDADA